MSWPAACARGPVCPQPVIRPNTSFGLRARQTSGLKPSFSMTPGRKPSINTSADSTKRKTASMAAGCFKSKEIDCLLRRSTLLCTACKSVSVGTIRSTQITSAPRSASSIPANGAGPSPASSITLKPCKGPLMSCPFFLVYLAINILGLPNPLVEHGMSDLWVSDCAIADLYNSRSVCSCLVRAKPTHT